MASCCFIGHRICPGDIKKELLKTIKELIIYNNINTFYVGTQGSFDKFVYEVLCDIKKEFDIKIFVVLAYLNKKSESPYYNFNETIFPDVLTKTPLRFAIRKRNSYMLNKSEYLISYINTPFSSTYTTIEEAIRKNLRIINLGVFDISRISLK